MQLGVVHSHGTLLSLCHSQWERYCRYAILNGIGIVIGIVTIIVVYLTSRRALTAQWVQTRSSRDEGRTSIGQYLGFRL